MGLDCEHRAARCLAAFQRTMRGGNILQCKALVNPDLYRTCGYLTEQMLGHGLAGFMLRDMGEN